MSVIRHTSLLFAIAATSLEGVAYANGGGGEGLALLPMSELVLPIVDGARADGRLRCKIVLRATDPAAAVALQNDMPALREVAMATVAEFARVYATPFAPIDARRLSRTLHHALHARNSRVMAVLLVEVSASRA